MQVYESIYSASLKGPAYLTIGNFDGVHRGHQLLIQAMLAEAHQAGAAAGLLTFHPHPRSVLRPEQSVASLTSLAERLDLYRQAGLDFVVVHPFTYETSQTPAEEFLHDLRSYLGVERLWVGPDFALGKDRKGDISFLERVGESIGVSPTVFPEVTWESQGVRASRIRRLIEIGNVEWAADLLGRFYAITGLVVEGAKRGRTIGFPTANLSLAQGRVVPANGVYATWVWIDEQRFPSVTNIGVRPTVNGSHRTIETHVIDFQRNLYGRCLRLQFVSRLRDEVKFPDLAILQAQIERDRNAAAELLAQDPQIADEERFSEVPHTADWVVEVRGKNREALYAHAALAMFALQGVADIDGPTVRQVLSVEGTDGVDLMVQWLSELLWHSETQHVSYQQFWVHSVADTSLRATITGRQGRSDLAHIKAVTYHDLEIVEPQNLGDSWRATILFDT